MEWNLSSGRLWGVKEPMAAEKSGGRLELFSSCCLSISLFRPQLIGGRRNLSHATWPSINLQSSYFCRMFRSSN